VPWRCFAFVLLLSTATAWSQETTPAVPSGDADKAADIKRLLDLTGGARVGQHMLDRLFEAERRAMPDVPEIVWQEARRAFETRELVELIAAIWDRHFSQDEIRGLIAFYESPLGTRLREMQPVLLQESLFAGEEWGRRALERLEEKLLQKGFQAPVHS
jgi:uncharacterized protein